MLSAEEALLAVRAWRDGVLIDDPTGVGEELQREAREWTWDVRGLLDDRQRDVIAYALATNR